MVTHKFSRSGYSDVEFDLQNFTWVKISDVIEDKVPNVGTRQSPLTISAKKATVTGMIIAGANSAESQAFNLDDMSQFGATVTLQIETDLVRTWNGIIQQLRFNIVAAQTENILFTATFQIDDYT
jgi:hypothetical protein